jgi:hypothetical protein
MSVHEHMVYLLPMKNTAHLKYTTFINNKMMYMYNDFNKSVHRKMSILFTQLEQDLVILVCEFSLGLIDNKHLMLIIVH